MHPTADTLLLIFGNLSGRRVMPGVRQLPLEQQMGVYILKSDYDQYQSFCFKNEADAEVPFRFNGKTITDWIPVSVEADVGKGGSLPASDFPSLLVGHMPLFSQRAVDALGEMLRPNGQLLPLDYGSGAYYAYNVTKLLDALDEERSEIVRFPTGRIMDIKRYAFIRGQLEEGLTIFKLLPTPLLRVFVTGKFVEAVERAGLTGFKFLPAV
jgi:uncharacterized protein DUF1629